ncbi:hypothetical protein C5167_034670 [Papaver somniferum]|uniref:Uncharacterized protein n=1 Tax=Papaver somniferum TaxID=3469 RepID=A0A4Y7KHF2_PAPSO|nr:hypothetical protein C5167_034670 [Papaver somniferum]
MTNVGTPNFIRSSQLWPVSANCTQYRTMVVWCVLLVSAALMTATCWEMERPLWLALHSSSKFSGEAAAAQCNFDEDYLQAEIVKIHLAVVAAWDNIELGNLPPLDAAKIPADKFNAFIEKFGLTKKKVWDHPRLQRFREEIEILEEVVDETFSYGKYGDAAGEDVIFGDDFKDWYRAVGRFSKGEIFKPENKK